MTYLLFTVSVTALDGSIGLLDPDAIFDPVIRTLLAFGILDAAVTADSDGISFTGQVKAASAVEAVKYAATAMFAAGYHNIMSMEVNPFEEEHGYDTLRVAVA